MSKAQTKKSEISWVHNSLVIETDDDLSLDYPKITREQKGEVTDGL